MNGLMYSGGTRLVSFLMAESLLSGERPSNRRSAPTRSASTCLLPWRWGTARGRVLPHATMAKARGPLVLAAQGGGMLHKLGRQPVAHVSSSALSPAGVSNELSGPDSSRQAELQAVLPCLIPASRYMQDSKIPGRHYMRGPVSWSAVRHRLFSSGRTLQRLKSLKGATPGA